MSDTLRTIAAEWLEAHGYGGLVSDNAGCGCRLVDIMPCDEPGADCRPGYLHECKAGCPRYDAEFDDACDREYPDGWCVSISKEWPKEPDE